MITITAALNRLIEMADVIDVSATCGCWVTQPGAYWEGRRLCECECDCECHGESDVIIRLTDQNRALAKALLVCLEALPVRPPHREDDYGVCFDWCPACRVGAALGELSLAVEANRG